MPSNWHFWDIRAGWLLNVLDDGGDPQQALANARTAIADSRVVAAIAHFSSMSALACVQTYHSAGLPVAIWGVGQDGITEIARVSPLPCT